MVKLLYDIINNLYSAFNVVIPGLGISISNIVLGLMVLTAIIFLLHFELSSISFNRGGNGKGGK